MNVEILMKILEIICIVAGFVVSTYIVPFLKSKSEAYNLSNLKEYIEFGVRCAEMYFDTNDGKAKKEYVTNYVKGVVGKLVNLDITDEQLDIMIESMVNAVKYGSNIKVD